MGLNVIAPAPKGGGARAEILVAVLALRIAGNG